MERNKIYEIFGNRVRKVRRDEEGWIVELRDGSKWFIEEGSGWMSEID